METNQGVLAGREWLVDRKQYPEIVDRVSRPLKTISTSPTNRMKIALHGWNCSGMFRITGTQKERQTSSTLWMCRVVLPLVQKISQAFVQLLDKSELTSPRWGGRSGVADFLSIQMGMPDKMQKLIDDNQEKVEQIGAETVVLPVLVLPYLEGEI